MWPLRKPDLTIGSPDAPYMLRWHLVPRNRWTNAYLHCVLHGDDDRALHDHPWPSVSLLLGGRYVEVTSAGRRVYRAGSVIFRRATHAHRLELVDGRPCWTLFLTGPKCREWGFICESGWRHWRDFVAVGNRGQVGRGCD